MLTFQILEDDGIVVIEPFEPLSEDDFKDLRLDVDRYLARRDRLRGVLILAPSFPGWQNFAGFVEHMRFVREHHRDIAKVAVVSDSTLAVVVPKLIGHFANAEVSTFHAGEREKAMQWLKGEE